MSGLSEKEKAELDNDTAVNNIGCGCLTLMLAVVVTILFECFFTCRIPLFPLVLIILGYWASVSSAYEARLAKKRAKRQKRLEKTLGDWIDPEW